MDTNLISFEKNLKIIGPKLLEAIMVTIHIEGLWI